MLAEAFEVFWGRTVVEDPTEGLFSTIRVTGRPIAGAAKLTVSARGRFWLPAVGISDDFFPG